MTQSKNLGGGENTHANPPVEGEHNQRVTSDAQCPDDEDEQGDNVVSMVRHIHFAEEAALGVCFLRLHALSGPHGSTPHPDCKPGTVQWVHQFVIHSVWPVSRPHGRIIYRRDARQTYRMFFRWQSFKVQFSDCL